jgi:hypothetical protein
MQVQRKFSACRLPGKAAALLCNPAERRDNHRRDGLVKEAHTKTGMLSI